MMYVDTTRYSSVYEMLQELLSAHLIGKNLHNCGSQMLSRDSWDS